jgi:hypothetical protein
VTGHGIDVVELPLGSTPPEALFSRAALPGPVALWTSVRPRLLVLASTKGPAGVPDVLHPGLPEGVLLHGSGSYVPLPPSRVRTGDVVWMRPPQALDWHLPELGEIVDLLTRRLLGDAAADATPLPPASAARPHRTAARSSMRAVPSAALGQSAHKA